MADMGQRTKGFLKYAQKQHEEGVTEWTGNRVARVLHDITDNRGRSILTILADHGLMEKVKPRGFTYRLTQAGLDWQPSPQDTEWERLVALGADALALMVQTMAQSAGEAADINQRLRDSDQNRNRYLMAELQLVRIRVERLCKQPWSPNPNDVLAALCSSEEDVRELLRRGAKWEDV